MVRSPPNILVVEDDRETRALIAKYLGTNACNVTTAADGREMVRSMTDHRVDLLILDVMLPRKDGYGVCRELRAAGEASRHRDPDARDQLTPHELQIVQLAAEGLTNREIGQRLYLSHRTVSSHLHRIFPKLGIASRSELRVTVSLSS